MIDYNDSGDERIYIINDKNINSREINLEDELKDYIRAGDKDITLDFKSVLKIDSLTLAMLVRIQQKLHEEGRELKLINLCERVSTVLEWSGLDDRFIIE